MEEFLQLGGELQIKGLEASQETTDIDQKTNATNNKLNQINPTDVALQQKIELASDKISSLSGSIPDSPFRLCLPYTEG